MSHAPSFLAALALTIAACSGEGSLAADAAADAVVCPGPASDAAEADAPPDAGTPVGDDGGTDGGAEPDAGVVQCSVNGNPGQCMDATACAGLPAFGPVSGYCPGPAAIQCCVLTPSTANNPPVPSGWTLMQQSQVTAEMTTWAVDLLHAPVTYPIWTTALRTFGALTVMARIEWHPPDFQNSAVHRGVTLYVP
jgi:hypothetical protein